MALTLDLNKSKAALTLSLSKSGLLTPPKVDVVIAMDVSGSFDDEHQSGITNDLIQRLIPWAMLFDPDQKIEFYTFSNSNRVSHRPDVTLSNYTDYIRKNVINCPGYNGGTDYAPVLKEIANDFSPKSASMFGLFKNKPVETKPVLVFFVTDGDNNDKQDTRQVFQAMQEKVPNIYVQFLGVSSDSSANFPFIDSLGEAYPNVGFTSIPRVSQWVQKTDDEVNEALISQELVDWLKG